MRSRKSYKRYKRYKLQRKTVLTFATRFLDFARNDVKFRFLG